ncbi:MAG: DedA family protein [Candidatus Beckwithbacteria bacterium]|nr:DedA family protein [Candidatus Beckwithbacteria bacterium]
MIESLIGFLGNFAMGIINHLGYLGISLAMAIESANIPLPSEIIMPFSGFLVASGRFTFLGTVIAGSLGGTLGSLLSYSLGYYGGEKFVRRLIKKYGKFLLIFEYELDEAEHWFNQHGQLVTFTSRLLPVVRTFISLPAGMSRMNVKKFAFFAFLGTFIWSLPLTYLGKVLGQNWHSLGQYFHKFDVVIFALGVFAVAFYVYHKLSKNKRYRSKIS